MWLWFCEKLGCELGMVLLWLVVVLVIKYVFVDFGSMF